MPEQSPESIRLSKVSKGKILVVEELSEARERLKTLPFPDGFFVETAPKGRPGLQEIEAGLDVLGEIRERGNQTPAFMCACGPARVVITALRIGVSCWFPNPWDDDKLILEIRKAVHA